MDLIILIFFFKTLLLQNGWAMPRVFITTEANSFTNSDAKTDESRLQLNWYNATPENDDWVGLFTNDPTTNLSTPAFKTFVNSDEGMVTTTTSLPDQACNLPVYRQCLGYWIGYVRDGVILASNCFQTQPNWMWENHDVYGKMPLNQLMIPGTHDAGSFQDYVWLLSENVVTQFAIAQFYNLWDQLAFGIRHFDLRISYNFLKNAYWLNHGPYQANPFEGQLELIRSFAASTKEIMVLDFHLFSNGFNTILGKINFKRHDSFVSLLQKKLGDLLIPREYGYNVTLDTLWKNNKRIMLCYNLGDYYKTNSYLWPGVYQAWANSDNVTQTLEYFDDFIDQPINYSQWSLQAALTPDIYDYIFTPFQGLRKRADELNPVITKYARDRCFKKIQIIATDFFGGNNLIEESIECNKKRAGLLLE